VSKLQKDLFSIAKMEPSDSDELPRILELGYDVIDGYFK
jgi:hypothetical protein